MNTRFVPPYYTLLTTPWLACPINLDFVVFENLSISKDGHVYASLYLGSRALNAVGLISIEGYAGGNNRQLAERQSSDEAGVR